VLAILRTLLLGVFFILSTAFLLLYLIVRPFQRNNVHMVARVYGSFAKMLGLEIVIRGQERIVDEPVVYIGNHQNTWDIFTASNGVRKGTVSVGKKSLKWMPFFGQVYWLSGNILIDRANKTKAHGTIGQAAQKIRDKKISVWLFPEGTRSRGRGLMKFKTGAFYTAFMAGVPMVPVAISSTHDRIKMNRWNNGKVVIEYLDPVTIESDEKQYIRQKAEEVREIMAKKIDELNAELGYIPQSEETVQKG